MTVGYISRVDPNAILLLGEDLDSNYASLSAAVTAIGASVTTLRISTANFPNGSTTTVPATLTLEFVGNGSILMDTGETVTILSDSAKWPVRQIFFNALASQGTVSITSYEVQEVYPEWWGASPTASAATNTPALQAAIIGAYGSNRTNPSGLWVYNRILKFSGFYNINDELQCYHLVGFRWEGHNKFNSGIVQTAANKRIIDGQSVTYGVFSSLHFKGTAASNIALLDIDYDASQGSDLRPQNITFQDCVISNTAFVGNFATGYIGAHIAKSGTGAQGDNIRFYNCYINGFLQAGLQIGGGANGVATAVAQNAIEIEWNGGDIQGCPNYGIAVYGGGINVRNATFENGNVTSADGVTQTGYDLFATAPAHQCTVANVRSEALRFADGPWDIKNCTVLGPQITLVGPGWPAIPGTTSFINQLVTGSVYGGDGKMYLVSNVATFGGLQTTSATGGSLTTVVKTSAGWTVNAFAGQRVTIMTGPGKYQYGVITSNTSDTLTCSAGFVSDYLIRADTGLPVIITAPTSSSTFLIEPDWGAGPTSSGTVNFALLDIVTLGNASTSTPFTGKVEAFGAGLGTRIYFNGGHIKDVIFTRQDWFTSNASVFDDIYPLTSIDNVTVRRYGQANQEWLPWSLPRNGYITGSPFRDYSHSQQGSQWSIWSRGDVGGGLSWVDLGIGRGDGIANNHADATSRNVLGFLGTLGRKTPAGTDQAGTPTRIQGGLSTGTGTEGALELWLGSAGSTGSAVNVGTKAASLTRADGFMLDKSLPLETDGGFSARWIRKSIQEEITLNTGGTTTDSTANMLPADSVIEAVVAVVSVTVTTATTIQVGDPTTTTRFGSFGGVGAGFKVVGLNHRKGSVTTDAAGPTQATAAKVRITTDVNPGAGKVNVVVFYSQFVAPSA